ncbi:CvpA family protein [Halosquirtibacter xylanolyticus]|uniref:CvpA family protein n=1 Tax=Halosquirtibacter xylanolyticus TaxID=3374599 RepID=UPI0037481E9E|nr:CvpA family protein [Prolixibacteraceae bacterium]
MNIIDAILGVFLVYGTYQGYKNGFIVEIATFLALFVGVFGSASLSELTEGVLVEQLNWHSEFVGLVSFVLTFILLIVGVHLLAKLLTKLADIMILGSVNYVAGAVFALIKVAFILSLLLVVAEKFRPVDDLMNDHTKSTSKLYKPIKLFAPSVFPMLEEIDPKEQWEKQQKAIKETMQKTKTQVKKIQQKAKKVADEDLDFDDL